MKKDRRRKLMIKGITCIVFICFVFITAFVNLIVPSKTFSENENRALAPFPVTSSENIFFGSFDTEFEKWFSDHFVARDSWIEMKASLRKDTGALDNNNVYFAGNGRLIQRFTDSRPEILQNNIKYLKEFSEDNDIRLNVMLVPGACWGEKNYLPLAAADTDEKELIRTAADALSEQNFIDLTEMMNTGDDNYFRTDHHWNANGAMIGYDAVCRSVLHKEARSFTLTEVSDSFRGSMYSRSGAFWTKPDRLYRMDPKEPLSVKVSFENGRETDSMFEEKNLNIKDKYTYYLDGNHGYVHISTDAGSGRKAVIIKDSYAHILIPYLAAEYSELEVFDLRYYHDQVSTHITDKENTDVYVIYGIETFCEDTNLAVLW